ncbi:DUF1569 domain-containing protein [Roseateles sp. DAIF2]|uniref:DUF1569 domain-containing protein n=1 Tax=Roseateles sp. DAIF2 TaxID=2714952 RepID=UPI0018A30ED3|nr:DUF1569 domain-containing protein [Roseateles sp. DAIF2]QPF75368.1 DUF1569 domain-containing protein [Roseateles sp. DAIF2]
MRRRQLLIAASAPLGLSGCAGALSPGFAGWPQARESVLELLMRQHHLAHEQWSLAQMLQHAAQSIEFSMQGYPEPKGALFQQTLGRAAFAWFDARGQMSHNLAEPIPGAPALDPRQSLRASVQRLLDAMDAFATHKGALRPHFAYGELSRAEYQRAHLMHLANHWTQVQALTATA